MQFGTAEIADEADNEASIGSGASITVSGAVTVDAGQTSANTATSNLDRKAGGAIDAGVLVSEASIHAGVLAQMDGDVDAGSLSVTADGDNTATATTSMVGGGALSFTGAGTLANVGTDEDDGPDAKVEARVGSSSLIDLGGTLTVGATSANTATATSSAASGGIVAATVNLPTATVSGATIAAFDGDVTDASQISIGATSNNTATATPIVITAGLIAAAGTEADADVTEDADTLASVGSPASITAPGAPVVGDRQRPQPRQRDRHERLGRLRIAPGDAARARRSPGPRRRPSTAT